jgi:hypothetical protein
LSLPVRTSRLHREALPEVRSLRLLDGAAAAVRVRHQEDAVMEPEPQVVVAVAAVAAPRRPLRVRCCRRIAVSQPR